MKRNANIRKIASALLVLSIPASYATEKRDPTKTISSHTGQLRDHDYYKAEFRKLEESTKRIHQEVDRILKEFRRNMEEYYKRTKGRGTIIMTSQGNDNIQTAYGVKKLNYTDPENEETTDFLPCSTIGDGDCFFHAAFTEAGETKKIVQDKAARMRTKLCDETIGENQYLDDLKIFVYREYMDLMRDNLTDPAVPEHIRAAYVKPYQPSSNSEVKELHATLSELSSQAQVNTINNEMLRQEISEEIAFKEFKEDAEAVTLKDIQTYMQRFRKVGGLESYILVPQFGRMGTGSPASIFATQGDRQISFFRFKTIYLNGEWVVSNEQLTYLGTVGTAGPIINILHKGIHFTRLFDASRNDGNDRRQCEQILKNYKER